MRADQRTRKNSGSLIAPPVEQKARRRWRLRADSNLLPRLSAVSFLQRSIHKIWPADSRRKLPILPLEIPGELNETDPDTVRPAQQVRLDRRSARCAAGCHIRVRVRETQHEE